MSSSPLVNLVLFMVCLALTGSILASAHYYAVDLPQQKTLRAPENLDESSCSICLQSCGFEPDYIECLSHCNGVCT